MARASASHALAGRAHRQSQAGAVRPGTPFADDQPLLRRRAVRRRLPLSEPVGARHGEDGRSVAGARVDLRRGLQHRLGVESHLFRQRAGEERRDLRRAELSSRDHGLPGASRDDEGVRPWRERQLGIPRPGRRAAVGEEEHRRLRRGSRERHADRSVGGLDVDQQPAGQPAREGVVQASHRDERRHVSQRRRGADHARRRRGAGRQAAGSAEGERASPRCAAFRPTRS